MRVKIKDIPFEKFYKICVDAYNFKKKNAEHISHSYFWDKSTRIKRYYHNRRMTNKRLGDVDMALKEQRIEKGLSQLQLAEATGVNVRMIQHYEQGSKDINGAKIYTLLRFCEALGCGLSDILTDKETLEIIERLNY